MLVVALPLLALLGLMAGLDYVRARDDALQAARARLVDAAERHASALEVRMRGIAQPARSMAAFLEADAGLTETDLYELLRRTVESDGLVVGSGVFFQPGAFVRPRGLVGSSVRPSGTAATRTPRPGEFAPYVQRVVAGASGGADGETAVRVPRALQERAEVMRSDLAEAMDYAAESVGGAGGNRWFALPRATGKAAWARVSEGSAAVAHAEPFFRGGRFAGVVRVDVGLNALVADAIREASGAGGVEVFVLAAGEGPVPVGVATSQLDRAALGSLMRGGGRGSAWLEGAGHAGGDGASLVAFAPAVSGDGGGGSGEGAWVVACVQARGEIMRPAVEAARRKVGDGLVFIGAAVVAVLGFSTWLVRPLRRLARAARAARVRALAGLGGASLKSEQARETRGAALEQARLGSESAETEQRLAREIQASLLPTVFPQRAEMGVHAVSQPARFVGGDFFDVFFVAGAAGREPRTAVVIADVAGKGVPAAMLMAVTRTLVRDLMSGGANPGDALGRANTLLLESNNDCLFASVFVGLYAMESGELSYANAGHPAPLVMGSDGATREAGRATGTVLGALPGATFDDGTIVLRKGERLVLFTDGVSEARDEAGTFLGVEGLAGVCMKKATARPQELCEALCDAARAYQGGTLRDDATVLVLERCGA